MATQDTGQTPRNAPVWVKVCVGLHVAAITFWSLPWAPEGVRNGTTAPVGSDYLLLWNGQYIKSLPPLQAYLFSTGAWQYWDMFAPDPVRTDFYGEAEIIYRDGTRKRYTYPRIATMPIYQKYFFERYRKYFERARLDTSSYLWPRFAQRIALANDDPANPPVRIRLYRLWQLVPKPGQTPPKGYESYMYYEHLVDPVELARDRKGG